MRSGWAAVLDVLCVLVFIAIGRATHEEGASLVGYAGTVWPFLVALGAGWAAGRVWRRPESLLRSGVVVWVTTLAGGMALRVLSGDTAATAFVVVAAGFLGLTMLGWRGLAQVPPVRRSLSRQA
ncbi:MAG TPA: DUF3054 domain-containing protein [Vulgatibacteraceae bacterium]|nr:DUF3054 domain-containing protein [Vulgatibacteraceae bacterium]